MRKGQAAMEFLMTYGWAILVVLAAIGALAYFGVLSPDKFLPDKCTASPPFNCAQYKVVGNGTNQISVTIGNNGGTDMSTVGVTMTCNDGSAATVVGSTNTTGILNGEQADYKFNCATGAPVTGQKFKGDLKIDYITASQTVDHVSTGSLQVRAE